MCSSFVVPSSSIPHVSLETCIDIAIACPRLGGRHFLHGERSLGSQKSVCSPPRRCTNQSLLKLVECHATKIVGVVWKIPGWECSVNTFPWQYPVATPPTTSSAYATARLLCIIDVHLHSYCDRTAKEVTSYRGPHKIQTFARTQLAPSCRVNPKRNLANRVAPLSHDRRVVKP